LAKQRRKELRSLIQSDPGRALELTVPVSVRQALPEAISEYLEERVDGRGRLAVLGVLTGGDAEIQGTFRTAMVGEREFKAYVYGRRLGEPTRDNIPLNGIAVDDLLALSEHPLRILEPAEAATLRVQDPLCTVSGLPANVVGQQIVAAVAGEPVFLCRGSHAVQLNDELTAAESGSPGPQASDPEQSTWTEGLKRMLIIRVDFPDLVGVNLTDAGASTLISNLNFFYTEMSYGRAGFYADAAGQITHLCYACRNPRRITEPMTITTSCERTLAMRLPPPVTRWQTTIGMSSAWVQFRDGVGRGWATSGRPAPG
jgi:hypothetical protein